jgi:hypothetical protein
MVTVPKYARLNKDALNKVQELEKDIGKVVLAYEPDDQSPYADLNAAQVEKIRALESELQVVILAYKPNQ